MRYKHEPTGKIIKPGSFFLDENGRRHTSKWANWPTETMGAFGIVEVPDPVVASGPRPDINEAVQRVVDIDGVWAVVDKDFDVAVAACNQKLDKLERLYSTEVEIDINGLVIPVSGKTLVKLAMGKRKPKATRKLVIKGKSITVTAAMTDAIDDAIITHHDAVDDRAAELQEAITAAETTADLLLIDMEAGWPAIYVAPIEVGPVPMS